MGFLWIGYRRALRFILPYRARLVFVLLAGIAATGFGLLQPYISKLLIDDALLKRNLRMLLVVSGLMLGVTVLGFVLNILSSYQYVRVSASVLFDMRLALYRHLQTLSPRFWARTKLGDVVSRINNDIAEVQRVSADSLLSVLSNVVFLIGSAAIMIALSPRLFLVSVAAVPASVWALATLPASPGGARANGPRAQFRHRKLPAGNAAGHPPGCVGAGGIAGSGAVSRAKPELPGCADAHAAHVVSCPAPFPAPS